TSGNVGIGTTLPTARLQVASSTAGSPSLFVTDTGNVGIGTTDPGTYSLYVAGDTYIGGITVTGGALTFGGDMNMQGYKIKNVSNIGIGAILPGDAGLTVMAGNLGIGTTGPLKEIEIAASNPALRLNSTKNGSWTVGEDLSNIEFYTTDVSAPAGVQASIALTAENTSGSQYGMAFRNSGDAGQNMEWMRIRHNGNVGIGTTSPLGLFQAGSGPTPGLFVTGQNGNVGVATTAPVYKLQVVGTLDATTITQGGSPISPTFANITSGTNTSAQMVVGSGANLGYAGSGTVNASSLVGNTWAAPAAIGSATPATGAFTTLTASLNVGIGTTAPNNKLTVNGDIGIPSYGGTGSGFGLNAYYSGGWKASVAGYSSLITQGAGSSTSALNIKVSPYVSAGEAITFTDILTIRGSDASGSVGIATTLPTGRLEVGTTRLGVPGLFVSDG
ncbi:MAG: hypothetical protein Q8O57_06950, partial [Kiritimatiellota bacterium]|nr:hypothetical protein [Kiritimatiellota bacterium]